MFILSSGSPRSEEMTKQPSKESCGTGSRGSLVSVRLDPQQTDREQTVRVHHHAGHPDGQKTLQSSFTPPALRFSCILSFYRQELTPEYSLHHRIRAINNVCDLAKSKKLRSEEHLPAHISDHKTSHKAQLRFIHNKKLNK